MKKLRSKTFRDPEAKRFCNLGGLFGGGGANIPSAPDANQVAQTQQTYNNNAALFNTNLARYNTNTPLGSQTWSITGTDPKTGAPIYSNNISLNQNAQNALTGVQQAQAGGAQLANGMLGGIGSQNWQNSVDGGNFTPAMLQAEQGAYGQQMNLLQPQMDQQKEQLQSQLANEGLTQGSDAWNNAMNNLQRTQGQIQTQAANQAVGLGQQEQNTLFGQGLSNANLNNNTNMARTQQLAQMLGMSNPQMPSFQPTATTGTQASNYSGDVYNSYQGQVNAANAQNASNNAAMGSLFGLIGTVGGAAIGGPLGASIGGSLGSSIGGGYGSGSAANAALNYSNPNYLPGGSQFVGPY